MNITEKNIDRLRRMPMLARMTWIAGWYAYALDVLENKATRPKWEHKKVRTWLNNYGSCDNCILCKAFRKPGACAIDECKECPLNWRYSSGNIGCNRGDLANSFWNLRQNTCGYPFRRNNHTKKDIECLDRVSINALKERIEAVNKQLEELQAQLNAKERCAQENS